MPPAPRSIAADTTKNETKPAVTCQLTTLRFATIHKKLLQGLKRPTKISKHLVRDLKIVPVLLILYTTAVIASERNCETKYSHITVTSQRNATGHWLATLKLAQRGSVGGSSDLMVLDIEPTSSRCEGVRTDSLLVQIQGPPPPPSPGYEYLQGFGYYKVHEETISWEEARKVCEKEDAHLLILNSEAEAAAILSLLKSHPKVNSWVHIGFNDKIKEGQYLTIFGQTLSEAGYTRWNAGQPDNAGNNENCGSIWAPTVGLNDLPCTLKTYFICEQSA